MDDQKIKQLQWKMEMVRKNTVVKIPTKILKSRILRLSSPSTTQIHSRILK